MEAENNHGKVKITIELDINQPAMELVKQNIEMMSETMPKLMQNWSQGMKGKGHGMGMMHHGQE